MTLTLQSAVSNYGASTKAKLANLAASGEPEEQYAPPGASLPRLAELCGFPRDKVTPVGETSLAELKTRPDFA